jgi:hypothetical protein
MPNKANIENDFILEMHNVGNYEQFSRINNSLQCQNENEGREEAIVEQIQQKSYQETDEDYKTKRE